MSLSQGSGHGPTDPEELRAIYGHRFDSAVAYRRRVWGVLVERFFQRLVPPGSAVLELGCGYGAFINAVSAGLKYGMDLNPAAARHLAPDVRFLEQDCSLPWALPDGALDVVFSSNFFEHLADKATLGRTFDHARRHLRPGGRLIAMGPNIKCVPGAYWDFWDHHVPLTESAMAEGLRARGFEIETCLARFLPYTMVGAREVPGWLIGWYLRMPWVWPLLGKQFLVVATKARAEAKPATGARSETEPGVTRPQGA